MKTLIITLILATTMSSAGIFSAPATSVPTVPVSNEKQIKSDIDLAAAAMDKAIATQIRYETLDESRTKEAKELRQEVGELKFSNFLKDVLIVVLAVVRITN